jgi:hypothetical protein
VTQRAHQGLVSSDNLPEGLPIAAQAAVYHFPVAGGVQIWRHLILYVPANTSEVTNSPRLASPYLVQTEVSPDRSWLRFPARS